MKAVDWVALYGSFFEVKGWSPETLNGLTPGQLRGIAGKADRPPSFATAAEAIAWIRAQKARKGSG